MNLSVGIIIQWGLAKISLKRFLKKSKIEHFQKLILS